MILIIKLVLAHIIGDFLLQVNSWVKAKEEKKAFAWQFYAHVVLHALVLLLILFDINSWKLILSVVISHLIIDYIKLKFQTKKTKTKWFFIDQLAHFSTIILIGLYWQNKENQLFQYLSSTTFITYFTALIFLSQPASIFLGIFIKPWTDAISKQKENSLKHAGKYIGIIERLLVFIFICTNHFEAIGFLLATKSVFRFGDLKKSKDKKLTEYILIGTLLSFGIALVIGLLTQYLINNNL